MKPKLWNGPHALGEGLVRGLEFTGSPYLSSETPDVYAGVMDGKGEVKHGVCSIYAEAGVVDLKAGGPLDPNITIPATLHKTTFVAAAGEESMVGAGRLKPPAKVSGKLPVDGVVAKSFSDTAKKTVAWRVPASMFTGRTRLYVQSLYGGTLARIQLTQGAGPRPFIELTTTARQDADLPAIPVATGSGVFFDQTDYSHWLVNPVSDRAYIYRLKASKCAERLRKKLGSPKLNAAEKERLETYILSHSLPEAAPSQTVTYPTTPTDSLGYSWHWNFSGDTCDMVNVVEKSVRPSVWGFESTHYRLAFSRDSESGTFAVTRSVVSGPTDWSVPKNINVIAYPDWVSGNLIKAGNLPSGISDAAQSGKVYAFYEKDELQVVTYSGTPTSSPANRVSDPPYFRGLYWSSPLALRIEGTKSGFSEGNAAWSGMSHVFSCAGVTVGGDNIAGRPKDMVSATWLARETGAIIGVSQMYPPYPGRDVGVPAVTVTYKADGSVNTATATWGTVAPTDTWLYTRSYRDVWTYAHETYTEVKGAFSLVVIPYMDAQAVYLTGKTLETRTGTRNDAVRYGDSSNVFDTSFTFGNISGPFNVFHEKYRLEEIAAISSPETLGTNTPINDSIETTQPCRLVCSAGVLSATPSNPGVFYSAVDLVEQSWGTVSSVNGVVVSAENSIATGSPIYPAYMSVVGWA